jgi:uncharacterized protein YkwD
MRTALLACSAVICCCAVLAWQPGAAHAKNAGLDRVERKVVRLVNRIRTHHGLRKLKASRTLAHAASDHTGDMLRADYLSHDSKDGTPMATRVRRYTGARWVGENIAVTSRRRGVARRVVRMWMASSSHRAVLLSPKSRRIGVGRERGRLGDAAYSVFTVDFASSH